jgi:hypothetical protein
VLYVTGISGSNDTTGKDCVRYGFRQNFYGETAANAIGPVLLKAYGKNKKMAFMTPDYTYGHTVNQVDRRVPQGARRLADGDRTRFRRSAPPTTARTSPTSPTPAPRCC